MDEFRTIDSMPSIVLSVDSKLRLSGVFHLRQLRWAGGKEHSWGGIQPGFGTGRLGKGLSSRREATTAEHGLARVHSQLAVGNEKDLRALER